jgi:hypothetical protein
MHPRPTRRTQTLRGKQCVFAQDPQHAVLGRAHPAMTQSRPHLAVPLAAQAQRFGLGQHLANDGEQISVAGRSLRPTFAGRGSRCVLGIHRRARKRPAYPRTAGRWRARPYGSSSRPPAGPRVIRLQAIDLFTEQLVGHGELTELGQRAARARLLGIEAFALEQAHTDLSLSLCRLTPGAAFCFRTHRHLLQVSMYRPRR